MNTLRCHPKTDTVEVPEAASLEGCIVACKEKEHCAAANFYYDKNKCLLCPNSFQLRGSGVSTVWIKDGRKPDPPSEKSLHEAEVGAVRWKDEAPEYLTVKYEAAAGNENTALRHALTDAVSRLSKYERQ
jgi:hypothetical protein